MSSHLGPGVSTSIERNKITKKQIGNKRAAIKIALSVQFCVKGNKHECFKIKDEGWFVLVQNRQKAKGKGETGNKYWFEVHSVGRVNAPEEVCKYIVQNIVEGDHRNTILTELLDKLSEGNTYHETKQKTA